MLSNLNCELANELNGSICQRLVIYYTTCTPKIVSTPIIIFDHKFET